MPEVYNLTKRAKSSLVVHPVNEFDISNACNFKAVRSIGLCGGLEMMDICKRSTGGRLENADQFAGCTT
jgi:hypothetical protein